jgi:hypothetical protein
MKQLEKRKGTCGYHGCCDYSFLQKIYNINVRKCLNKSDHRRCLRWESLPKECQIYPFDERDKIPETKSFCSFYWEEKR